MRPHQLLSFWIPEDAATWAERMEAGSAALEARFGMPLRLASGGTKFHVTTTEIADRPRFFRERLRTKNRWCSLTSRRSRAEPGAAVERVGLGGSMYGGGELYHAMGTIEPEQSVDVHEKALAEVGDALGAHFSAFLPWKTEMRLRLAHRCSVIGTNVARFELPDRTPEEAALPVICESLYAGLQRLQPHHLGWVNYWSQEVCDYVGFPQNLEGTPYLADCYRTPGGAWIVKFGREPFAPRNGAHLELLREMYERFPRVAIRLDR